MSKKRLKQFGVSIDILAVILVIALVGLKETTAKYARTVWVIQEFHSEFEPDKKWRKAGQLQELNKFADAKGPFFNCPADAISGGEKKYSLEEFLADPEFKDFNTHKKALKIEEHKDVYVHYFECNENDDEERFYPFITFEYSDEALYLDSDGIYLLRVHSVMDLDEL